MDRKTFYKKTESALNQAFDAIKYSVAVVSEKAGEAASLSKLMLQKVQIEHRATKNFNELGSKIYKKAKDNPETVSIIEKDLKKHIDEAVRLEKELTKVELEIEKERKKIKEAPKKKPVKKSPAKKKPGKTDAS